VTGVVALSATVVLSAVGLVVGPATPAMAETNPGGTFIRAPQTFYAYVGPGENLDVSFVKSIVAANTDTFTFTVRGPGGVTRTCQVAGGTPMGSRCDFANLTSGTPGVWAIEVQTTSGNADSSVTWTINVQDAGGTRVPGRVWSERYGMTQPGNAPLADFSLWYQSEFGYTYQADYTDYHGIDSRFQADNFGVVETGTCATAYRSALMPDWDGTYEVAAGACGGTYKLFFEPPDPSLPAGATRWDGATEWIKPPIADPAITNVVFDLNSTGARDGTLSFDLANYSGPITVQVDANGDGDYTDSEDRSIPLNATEGTNAVPFDGLDGTGQPIPPTQEITFQVVLDRVAEIHFVSSEVEVRGGLEVTRLNGPADGRKTLYWNDTALPSPDPNRCSTTPVLDGRGGVDSTGGVHGWDLGSCGSLVGANRNDGVHGSWGDTRMIDDWALVPVEVVETLTVPPHGLTIEKSVSPRIAPAGGTVTYTVTVTNSGEADYTQDLPARYTDDLTGVLDDAVYNGDASASVGQVSFAEPELTWSGPLAVGEVATITYTVTVNNPTTGDLSLENVVTDGSESNCVPPDPTDPRCKPVVPVRSLHVAKAASHLTAEPGDVVTYTVTVTNTGNADYTADDPASISDDLTGVLDDAVYNGDASASVGQVSFAEPTLTWSGPLAIDEVVTITYTVTVDTPATGDQLLENVVTDGIESNCVPPDPTDPDCRTVVPVVGLHFAKAVSDEAVAPGDVVTYTVTVTNTGEVAYTEQEPATFTDDLTEVLDDAAYNDDASASAGRVSFAEPTLTWAGPLPIGGVATITYSVTVNDPVTGDLRLDNVITDGTESNCVPPAEALSLAADRTESTGEECRTMTSVVPPLPVTGVSLVSGVGVGLLLIGTGAGLLLLVARRRRAGQLA
jgi:uncharacterized repeat protein (TIGR01451 family)